MNANLITTAKVKDISYIDKNVEDSILKITIQRVQDNIIQPIIGTSLYKRLLAGITANDLNSDEETLLNDYIAPCIASACDYKIIYPAIYKTRNKTVGANRDEIMTNAGTSEATELRNEYRKDFEPYRLALIGFLKDNETLYPEYYNWVCSFENIAPDKGKTKTNIRFI
jgi:hypothetical protein